MAIDTRDKRSSATQMFWQILAPLADGTVETVDREHITGIYMGISASAPAVWTDIVLQGFDVISGEIVHIIGKYK